MSYDADANDSHVHVQHIAVQHRAQISLSLACASLVEPRWARYGSYVLLSLLPHSRLGTESMLCTSYLPLLHTIVMFGKLCRMRPTLNIRSSVGLEPGPAAVCL